MGIIYKKKEGKYTKPFEFFVSMRNKELGLIEPEANDEDDASEKPLNEVGESNTLSNEAIESIEADNLDDGLALTS